MFSSKPEACMHTFHIHIYVCVIMHLSMGHRDININVYIYNVYICHNVKCADLNLP